MRILLVDDDGNFRRALMRALRLEPDIQIVGEASTGEAAVALAGELHPEVILMDVRMPGLSGIEAARQIHSTFPDICIVALSSLDCDDVRGAMMRAGAFTFVVKGESQDALMKSLRACFELVRKPGFTPKL